MSLTSLLARGFDRSAKHGKWLDVRCSGCAALVICGTAVHETGCPNETRECEECNTRIPMRQRLCEDCANPEPEPMDYRAALDNELD